MIEFGGCMSEAGGSERGDAQLDRLVQAVKDFRHDVGTPLTAIMAEAELLLMDADQLSAEQKRGVEAIGKMARRIRDVVAQLDSMRGED
jgi:signal transduction histidine kinase